jgi:hypothetical protein
MIPAYSDGTVMRVAVEVIDSSVYAGARSRTVVTRVSE